MSPWSPPPPRSAKLSAPRERVIVAVVGALHEPASVMITPVASTLGESVVVRSATIRSPSGATATPPAYGWASVPANRRRNRPSACLRRRLIVCRSRRDPRHICGIAKNTSTFDAKSIPHGRSSMRWRRAVVAANPLPADHSAVADSRSMKVLARARNHNQNSTAFACRTNGAPTAPERHARRP